MNITLLHLTNQVVLIVLQRPFERNIVCVLDGTTQLILFLVDRNLVSSVCQINGSAHSTGASTDNRNILLSLGCCNQEFVHRLKAEPGVHGAAGSHNVMLTPSMTLVAPETGYQILCLIFIEEIAIVGIGDPCAGHSNHIQLTFRNGLFRHLRIEPSAHI